MPSGSHSVMYVEKPPGIRDRTHIKGQWWLGRGRNGQRHAMSTLSTSNNNNNASSDDGVNPSDYNEDYIGDDSKYAFTTSAPATPLSSANKIAAMLAQHGVSKPRPFQLDAFSAVHSTYLHALSHSKNGRGKITCPKGDGYN
eukprot:scaffold11763_cov83-Skeletonema_marinoi.AAC.3